MAERLRAGVIGLGSMGANHARVLAALPDVDLAAVADVDGGRLERASYGAAAYRDYRDMLARERLDAVTIAVPTRLHLDLALACLERVPALLVEKPAGADLAECRRLRDAGQAAGAVLMPGHIERFNPVVRELKRRVDAGELGRVYGVHVQRIGPFYERERDVGVVHDLATHDIDVLRWLFGEVERVHAETQAGVRTPYEDALVGTLRFASGVVAVIETDWLSAYKLRSVRVTAERGTLQAHYEARRIELAPDDDPRHVQTLDIADQPETLRLELEAFLRAARREAPPPVGADDAIAAMRVVEALIESARTGQAVRVLAGSAPA